jgi:hypothetical protein
MTSVSELTGGLASRIRYGARTASSPLLLGALAAAYDEHVFRMANVGEGPDCGHVKAPPYIIVAGAEEKAWCIECVKAVLRNDSPMCASDPPHRTKVYMFPFGDIVAAGNICPDCGEGPAFATARPDEADA